MRVGGDRATSSVRLHFGVDDLARTRIVATLGPLAETMLALGALRSPVRRALFDPWRRHSRRRLAPCGAEISRVLAPPGRLPLDVFSLLGRTGSIEEGLEGLVAAPHRLLRAELEPFAAEHPRAWPLRDLSRDDRRSRRSLRHALAACHDATVRPYWPSIRAWVEAEAHALARSYADGGLEGLLGGRGPGLTWRSPVLEVSNRLCPHDADVHLDGRGLAIVPAFFATEPFCAAATDGSAVYLLVPAPPTMAAAPALWSPPARRPRPGGLGALLGATRAAVLEAAAAGRTTGEIARHLGISPAGASQHAAVLREAGLLVSRRERNTVVHTLTPSGRALLNRA
ncbi:helix-turn-helix domain-containing protein [Actinomadura fibrosa]|uniref:Winged helix-turn-helix domain-containing protein n=2 Tax=Actinomadura fibrosa TaxID=111802 RepID=A0ABW2XIV4_9ACTN